MGKAINIIYGILMICVAFFAIINKVIPHSLLPFAVIALGVLLLITPLEKRSPYGYSGVQGIPRPAFQWLRRWVFGIYLIVSGLVAFLPFLVEITQGYGGYLSIYTLPGQLILFAIGAITFLLAIKRTRQIQVASY